VSVGSVFGRWTVVARNGSDKNGEKMFDCVCSCGSRGTIQSSSLRRGGSKGCKSCAEKGNSKGKTHGLRYHPLYVVWKSMNTRCSNKKAERYKNYGGRGITVCDRWLNSFPNFLKDMGDRPSKSYSIDRIDNDKGYSPENCRWATRLEQANNRSVSKLLRWDGVEMTVTQWARKLDMKPATLKSRIRSGWSTESALSTPIRKGEST
jgi:hypothetical protein